MAEVAGGFPLDPGGWVGSQRELLDLGEIGTELFDGHDWSVAVPYLTHVWDALQASPPRAAGDPRLLCYLRVGTQLANWLAYQGEHRPAQTVIRPLLKVGAGYRSRERPVLEALACAYRHHTLTAPSVALRYGEEAERIFREVSADPLHQIAVLRDQAKPHCARALEQGEPAEFAAALSVLDRAEALAERLGGERARREGCYTRLTRVQCQVAQGAPAPPGAWAELLAGVEAEGAVVAEHEPAFRSAVSFTRVAVALATHDPEQLAAAVTAYRSAPDSHLLRDRLARVEAIEVAIRTNHWAEARQILLR
jgi:hypothetical protein